MKRWFLILLVVVVIAVSTVSIVAASGTPIGGCAGNFHLHEVMDPDHDHEGPHQHVGNDRDQNGDGWICVKHVGVNGSIHVHTDNNIPLP